MLICKLGCICVTCILSVWHIVKLCRELKNKHVCIFCFFLFTDAEQVKPQTYLIVLPPLSHFSCVGPFSRIDLQFFSSLQLFPLIKLTRMFNVSPVYAWSTNSVQMQTKVTINTEQNTEYEEKKQTLVKTETDTISREKMFKKNLPSSPPRWFHFPLQPEIPLRLHQTETVKWEQDGNWPQWLWMVRLRISVKVWQSTSCVAPSWYMKNRVGGRAWKMEWRRANPQFCVTLTCPSWAS